MCYIVPDMTATVSLMLAPDPRSMCMQKADSIGNLLTALGEQTITSPRVASGSPSLLKVVDELACLTRTLAAAVADLMSKLNAHNKTITRLMPATKHLLM